MHSIGLKLKIQKHIMISKYKTFQGKINNVNDYFPIIEFLISKNARLLNGSSLNVDALETNTYHI